MLIARPETNLASPDAERLHVAGSPYAGSTCAVVQPACLRDAAAPVSDMEARLVLIRLCRI